MESFLIVALVFFLLFVLRLIDWPHIDARENELLKKGLNMPPVPKRKVKNKGDIKQELDRLFSLYVRSSSADSDGYVYCVTCQKQMPWKEAEAGHYIDRKWKNTAWDDRNVFCQCHDCNCFREKKEMISAYENFLNAHYRGLYMPEQLRELSRQNWKESLCWYYDKIDDLKRKLRANDIKF